MSFAYSEHEIQVRDEIRRICSAFGLDYWYERDSDASYPWDFVKAFAESGWLGLVIPEEYGGSGGSNADAAIMMKEIAASGAGATGASAIHFYLFPPMPIVKHGSEEMKRRVLPAIARGETLMAFGVTEPDAGSDTSRIRTRATRTDDGAWRIDGQKIWTTNAQNATHILVLARTQPRDDAHRFEGMTLFFVPMDRERCDVREIPKLGRAAIDSNEVFIDGLVATDDDIVGQEGKGFFHLIDGLNPERIMTAMEAVGIGEASLRLATEYAKNRIVFDRPIGMNQGIAHPLAHAWMELQASELLALQAARLFDEGRDCGSEATAAKYLAADAAFRACDSALQTFGGFGYAREYHVERLWRECRIFRLAPVSQEMALNYVAQKVLRLPKSY